MTLKSKLKFLLQCAVSLNLQERLLHILHSQKPLQPSNPHQSLLHDSRNDFFFQVWICRQLNGLKRQEFGFFSERVWRIKWQLPCNILSMDPYSKVSIYPHFIQSQAFFQAPVKQWHIAIFYKAIWTTLTLTSKSPRIVHISNTQLYEWLRSVRQRILGHHLLS